VSRGPGFPLSAEPGVTARRLALVTALLSAAHVVAITAYFGGYVDCSYWQVSIFDLDAEQSLGTWFSAVLLLLAGRLLVEEHSRSRDAGCAQQRGWALLAVGFHLLSLDEVAGLHESLNTALETTSWTLFGAAGAALLLLVFAPFLGRLDGRTRAVFLVAGLIYLGGAIGVERSTDFYADTDQLHSLAYNLWNTLEETLEMAGVVLFIHALQRRQLLADPVSPS